MEHTPVHERTYDVRVPGAQKISWINARRYEPDLSGEMLGRTKEPQRVRGTLLINDIFEAPYATYLCEGNPESGVFLSMFQQGDGEAMVIVRGLPVRGHYIRIDTRTCMVTVRSHNPLQ